MSTTIEFSRSNGEWHVGDTAAKEHKLKLDKGSGEHKLKFKLSHDAQKAGFRFNSEDPIWVHADAANCPNEYVQHGQITDIDCDDTELKVKDLNSEEVVLRYQLNVVDDKGKSSPIDPIIDNGGHGFQ